MRLTEKAPFPKVEHGQSYQHTLALRKFNRAMQYFKAQQAQFVPKPHIIVQRTLAHPEILDNMQW